MWQKHPYSTYTRSGQRQNRSQETCNFLQSDRFYSSGKFLFFNHRLEEKCRDTKSKL